MPPLILNPCDATAYKRHTDTTCEQYSFSSTLTLTLTTVAAASGKKLIEIEQ